MSRFLVVLAALVAGFSPARGEEEGSRTDEAAPPAEIVLPPGAIRIESPQHDGEGVVPPGMEVTNLDQVEATSECPHESLFGGTLVPIGDEYAHVEIVFDPDQGLFMTHFLDGDALEPVRLRQNMFLMKIYAADKAHVVMLVPKEDEETGEKHGDTSVFWGANRELIGKLEFGGIIDMLGVKGRGFSGLEFSYPR